MLNIQYLFYSLGLFGILLIIFNNTPLSSESYSYNTHTLDSPYNHYSNSKFLTSETEDNFARKKGKNEINPRPETLSHNSYYKPLQERELKKKGKKKKVAGAFPKKRTESSKKKANSDEKTIDNLIKDIDENDPLLKRVAYALERQRKSKNKHHNNSKSAVNKNKETSKSQQSKGFTAPISVLKKEGPFKNLLQRLGAYPEVPQKYFNSDPGQKPSYEVVNYGLYNDEDYCQLADLYNLEHPENMFKRMTFFTDYDKDGLPRKDVMRKIGHDISPKVTADGKIRKSKSRTIHIDQRTTMFYTLLSTFHLYHKIGKHFLCATQMYNHIPGHGALKRKDLVADNVNAYALRYRGNEACFNKNEFFPQTYRLYIKEECREFIKTLNSGKYANRLEREPIYVVKSRNARSHSNIVDFHQASLIREAYDDGNQCGKQKDLVIVQNYINNPFLVEFNNKFNLRIFILIASTNPIIAFYHDGLLRASLFPYSKTYIDRNVHLTNTHLSKDIFAEAVGSLSRSLHGMTETEMRDYQIWTFERLEDYLLKNGHIKEPGWADNYLRPKLKEVAIHLVRMSESSFWSQSNVFELFALDFLVDDQLKLWFIECNSLTRSSLNGSNEFQTSYLTNMLKDMFEIQYAYYRSRMKRVMNLLKDLESEQNKTGSVNYGKWKDRYNEATKNKLEPEYPIAKNNAFEILIDRNRKGSKAYFGILKDECVDD